MDFLAALEASALASALRQSIWVYPLVNAAHIAGIALLVGAIVTLDLRLLGLWPSQPPDPLASVLLPVATTGLVIAALAGGFLFAARATAYATSPIFVAKIALVAIAVLNAVLVRRSRAWRTWRGGQSTKAGAGLRLGALVSLSAWTGVLLLGRLVGYFQ